MTGQMVKDRARWLILAALTAALSLGAVPHGVAQESQPESHAKMLSRAFRTAAERVMPSVVKIRSETRGRVIRREMENPFRGTPFEDFFGEEFERRFQQQLRVPPRDSLGSGVIIDPSGIVLTNNHVVAGADAVVVVLEDGTEYRVKEIHTDPRTDLAVVRIDAGRKLPAAKLGDSDALEIGDWVIAIGHPFELEQTVSAGIISGKGRQLGSIRRADFLQTDAAINPGNSGGPLVNLDGEVIGINTAIASNTGAYQGIGFAIPINLAKWVSRQLVDSGKVQRAYLGVQIERLSPDLARQFNVAPDSGVLVASVFPDSPGAKAKLREGDVIVAFAGQKVRTPRDLQLIVERSPIDRPLPMRILRDGTPLEVQVTLAAMPADFDVAQTDTGGQTGPPGGRTAASEALGVEVTELTPELAQRLGFEDLEGVLISQVDPDSPAARKGLQPGMLILRVGREAVTSVEQFEKLIAKESVEEGVLLLVRDRDNRQFFVVVKR